MGGASDKELTRLRAPAAELLPLAEAHLAGQERPVAGWDAFYRARRLLGLDADVGDDETTAA